MTPCTCGKAWMTIGPIPECAAHPSRMMPKATFEDLLGSVMEADAEILRRLGDRKPAPLDDNWMRVAPGTDAAIWRPWSRETGEL
jgi:hypothetical protein